MKKYILYIVCLFILFSCTSAKMNLGLKLIGAYDDDITLTKLGNDQKEIVFVPMIHVGTELFYQDVRRKMDSLQKVGYFIYYEHVNGNFNDSILMYKIKKFQGFPIAKINLGYLSILDSQYKIKYKKKLIDQPSYDSLGIAKSSSKNVDITIKQFIDEYEKRYGEIILKECDFKTSIYEKTICNDKPIDKKIRQELMTDFRNEIVINEIKKDEHKKIAIVYGKLHFVGIKKELENLGYKVVK